MVFWSFGFVGNFFFFWWVVWWMEICVNYLNGCCLRCWLNWMVFEFKWYLLDRFGVKILKHKLKEFLGGYLRKFCLEIEVFWGFNLNNRKVSATKYQWLKITPPRQNLKFYLNNYWNWLGKIIIRQFPRPLHSPKNHNSSRSPMID